MYHACRIPGFVYTWDVERCGNQNRTLASDTRSRPPLTTRPLETSAPIPQVSTYGTGVWWCHWRAAATSEYQRSKKCESCLSNTRNTLNSLRRRVGMYRLNMNTCDYNYDPKACVSDKIRAVKHVLNCRLMHSKNRLVKKTTNIIG